MTLSSIEEIDGEFSLTFYCGDLTSEAAISEAGHEPNGYFWEGVVEFISGALFERIELDSEGSMFCAIGEQADLTALQSLLEPLLADDAMRGVIARAKAAGFEFDD